MRKKRQYTRRIPRPSEPPVDVPPVVSPTEPTRADQGQVTEVVPEPIAPAPTPAPEKRKPTHPDIPGDIDSYD